MATNLLTCCERLDESKYWHKCACPSATVTCESEEKNADLCGRAEYEGNGVVKSVPPKKYRVESWSGVYKYALTSTAYRRDWTGTWIFDVNNCSNQYNLSYASFSGTSGGTNPCTPSVWFAGGPTKSCDVTLSTTRKRLRAVASGASCQLPPTATLCTNTGLSQLSSEDTETDALARETPILGTSCSSLWESRTTSYSFTVRTVTYIIECVDLVIGIEYEVTPAIRRRTATAEQLFGPWEDVVVTPYTFIATATTETIDNGDSIELDNIQGYQYEITGVNIEKAV